MDFVLVIAVLAATLAIFSTTRSGQTWRRRIGLGDGVAGAASHRDVAFLIEACGGDQDEAARRVAEEQARVPALTEAEHYRRAIRRVLAERGR
jgi:hypothetical protein